MCTRKVTEEELERMDYEAICQLRDHAVLLDEMLKKLGYESLSLLEIIEEIKVHIEAYEEG